MKLSRISALCAFFVAVLALGLVACGGGGGGVPGNAVAKVDDQSIKRGTFDHWMQIAAVGSAAQANQGSAAKAKVPDAPDFKQCIAAKRAAAGKPAKGQPKQTDATLKQQCRQSYDQLRDQVLQFLIRATWLDQEASRQDVKVTDADVQKSIDAIKKQQFPKAGDYEKYLKGVGLTNADVLFQQRTQLLEQKITQKVTKGKDKVTDAQISAYYDKNKSRFATPERRDLLIVLTKDEATAKKAKAALQSGRPWAKVAKQYSIDTQSKKKGGALVGVAKGQQEKAFDTAAFAASKGKLVGPVKTQFGWYVLKVTKITPAKQQSLEQSKASIKQILASSNQQKALKAFGNDYRKRYKDKTDCRDGFVVQDCKNAPKQSKTQTTQTTQTTTQP
jgi:parvulin-like peptidyl-prolyl isomerase